MQTEIPKPQPLDHQLLNSSQLEAHLARQSAEIEALRAMLRSEHDRHVRAPQQAPKGTTSRITQALRRALIGLSQRCRGES